MQSEQPRTRTPQRLVPTVRAAQSAVDGYAALAAEVVHQAALDALLPAQRADVLGAIQSGALSWWLAQAGVDDRYHGPVLAAISARARAPLALRRR